MSPAITLHVLPPSHPCMTAEAALRLKGLEYERVALEPGKHPAAMAEIYGEGKTTVPGMVVDGEPVHGSLAISACLEELVAEPSLFAGEHADRVREAEVWGDGEPQDLGRRLPWGAMHLRPEAMGTFGGAEALDGPGTDFAIAYVRA
ncbi:MAG: glutathione S-transferase N-terminal domain-containing protein, partial [Solirubrobacteraceae bacterium]